MLLPMSSDALLLRSLFDDACCHLDAGRLAGRAVRDVPEGAGVLGLGKMAHRMVTAALEARPDLVPVASVGPAEGDAPWMRAGDHPVPGTRSFAAGRWLLERVSARNGSALVLLLSGGGSALAEAPLPGLSDDDLVETTARLLRARMPIDELNAVRRRLSAIKGGRLAQAAPTSRWQVFVLSDVVGDDPAVVASGPCAFPRDPPRRAERACREAGVWDALPERVRQRLEADPSSPSPDTLEIETTVLAGARALGLSLERSSPWPTTVLAPVDAPVEVLADRYLAWARAREGDGPMLLVATGEPLLEVRGPGRGGRAQHLALLMARSLAGMDATFLALGTDGRDGPTDHAGAWVDGTTAERAGDRLEKAIDRYDSATFHAEAGTAVARFPPVTHLGEAHLLLVR